MSHCLAQQCCSCPMYAVTQPTTQQGLSFSSTHSHPPSSQPQVQHTSLPLAARVWMLKLCKLTVEKLKIM